MKYLDIFILVAVLVGAAISAAIILFTPLRYTLIAPPAIKDIDPKVFYTDFVAHPDAYLFIDVRQKDAYEASHAKGSTNIPLQDLYYARTMLPKSGKIIALICSNGASSGVGYGYLQHYGFTNIERIAGGVENWAVEGLPLEGKNVITRSSKRSERVALKNTIMPCSIN